MKSTIQIILFLLAISLQAETIPFNGSDVNVIGSFIQLEINGTDEVGAVEVIVKNYDKQDVDHAIVDNELRLALNGEAMHYIIRVPKNMNIKLHPVPIIFEGSPYSLDSYLPVAISSIEGQVAFMGDGYNVDLIENTSDISVVTYGNINLRVSQHIGDLISLDTYTGSIDVKIPDASTNLIRAKANKGNLKIDDPFKNKLVSNKTKIVDPLIHLHSEKGQQISVQSISKKDSITHPELRDQLIKMYLEDQGKQLISNATESDLRAQGYGPFIDALPEIPNWHRDYKDKHKKQLREMFSEHGLPTKEMIGSDYAYNMLSHAFIQYKDIRNEFRSLAVQVVNPEVLELLERAGR